MYLKENSKDENRLDITQKPFKYNTFVSEHFHKYISERKSE